MYLYFQVFCCLRPQNVSVYRGNASRRPLILCPEFIFWGFFLLTPVRVVFFLAAKIRVEVNGQSKGIHVCLRHTTAPTARYYEARAFPTDDGPRSIDGLINAWENNKIINKYIYISSVNCFAADKCFCGLQQGVDRKAGERGRKAGTDRNGVALLQVTCETDVFVGCNGEE